MKNQHIIYVYGEIEGGCVLVIGITDIGYEYLKKERGNFLDASHPNPKGVFKDVKKVMVLHGKDKDDIKKQFSQAFGKEVFDAQ